ncbi:MAG: HNH endonuclease [Oscillospiraceae bacterium]|nr:HNH endonuclease [Oscillospiraceae bacterium]
MHHDERIEAFYTSRSWRKCRESFLKEKGGLCENCLAKGLVVPAVHVHHRTPITPETVMDPRITMNHGNLMALCEECHQAQHRKKRWRCDAFGHVSL